MIRYKVIKNGIVTNQWTSDFAGTDYYEPNFGLQERWVNEANCTQEQKDSAIDSRTIDDINQFKLPAEYIVEQEDITSEVEAAQTAAQERANRMERLQSVDFSSVTTIAALKAVVKDVLEELLSR